MRRNPTKQSTENTIPEKGQRGSDPVLTALGAAGAATTGATLGSAVGPVGTAVGLAVGAVAGGIAGNAVAQALESPSGHRPKRPRRKRTPPARESMPWIVRPDETQPETERARTDESMPWVVRPD